MPTLKSALALGVLLAGLASLSVANAATPIPDRVFSPYFETWTGDQIHTIAKQSGARYFTLAFLETLGRSSCKLAWNGDPGQLVGSGAFEDDIAKLRTMGGDVTISFGGWSADQHGREIGDSCKDVDRIVDAYKKVITTYGVSRLDMDIEGRALGRDNGIDRRNRAIALLQQWAKQTNRPLTISYTLPRSRDGLEPDAMAVLKNAVSNGVHLDIVQPMVFDYYDGSEISMSKSAVSALQDLHSKLAALLPNKSSAQIWKMEGATMMIGRDDYPTDIETTTIQDARNIRGFAEEFGLAVLSFWAIQRDNGSCPGQPASDSCSGIAQRTWAFTKALKGFTSQ
jgi:hypothetical protein